MQLLMVFSFESLVIGIGAKHKASLCQLSTRAISACSITSHFCWPKLQPDVSRISVEAWVGLKRRLLEILSRY